MERSGHDPHGGVLIVANDFPPVGGSSVQRAVYFSKYLPRFGWRPTVLTVKEVAFPVKDPTLLDELPPEVTVVRTESFELRRLLWLAGRLRARLGREDRGHTESAAGVAALGARPRELGRTLRRWLFVPDDRMLWAPFAVLRGLRLARRGRLSSICATVPAYSSAVIGYWISRLTGLPLILDLRDPWTRDPYLPAATRFHAWVDARLEAKAVGHAARVVVISAAMRRGFVRAYPEIDPARFVVITNGFDAEVFEGLAPVRRGEGFVLTYVGSLYAHHRESLRAVCSAWSELAESDPELTASARLLLIGRCDPEIQEELAAWPAVRSEVIGYLPHLEGLRHLRGASALLLLIKDLDPESQIITIPGKLFEYVAAGRPILMIGPEGRRRGDRPRDWG
jgi:glycosyltransferase involved in cell wall biosynthesis